MITRWLAALLLGLPLAVALIGPLALWGPGTPSQRTLPLLLLFFPLWMACICLPFAMDNVRRACAWMTALALCGLLLSRLALHLGALGGLP